MYTPQIGDYGVVKTHGVAGEAIRVVTISRWNHAVICIGDGFLVEATPYGVIVSPISKYPLIAWNKREDLTNEQRSKIKDHAMAEVGKPYSFLDIAIIFLRIFGLSLPPKKFWNRLAKRTGYICSELVAECYSFAGIKLFNASWCYSAAGIKLFNKPDNLVTPGDLAERLVYA